jgi:hypothetical protein
MLGVFFVAGELRSGEHTWYRAAILKAIQQTLELLTAASHMRYGVNMPPVA